MITVFMVVYHYLTHQDTPFVKKLSNVIMTLQIVYNRLPTNSTILDKVKYPPQIVEYNIAILPYHE